MRSPLATVLVVFLVAVALNYPWELAQGRLFEGMSDLKVALWHCFVASLGDGILVLIVLAFGMGVLRRDDWFERPGLHGYLVMLPTGIILAVAVEAVAVHVLHRWTYTDAMPRIPGLEIGLVPIAQMLVLPPLIFFLASAILTKYGRRSPLGKDDGRAR
jgi:hypothetical protein